ncbi:hypothetical protein [Nocardia wallacei]|uniref:hypothetical protein n=1 Tax=Nocardia wallacei TaxID=480035 RepID=UPI0024547B13|nr:hypothetical protein [Nocardia wallacei]
MATLVLLVFPGLLGVASAQYADTVAVGHSQMDGLSWMQITDSSGVPLANYTFVTDHGGVFDPGNTVLWTILGLEAIGYMTLVTTAIWFIGYALSFGWLDLFSSALHGVADALSRQLATPTMLITAATIGAFFVAWFVVRGYHAKATTQAVTMLFVAAIGPVFLAEPLADVLSPHGLLAQGRDLGLTVAAGLNGQQRPDPARLVPNMQGQLADSFARRPLQVWNFGHVIDERPSCALAWSSGVSAADEDRLKNGIEACGDSSARAKADDPSMGQVGTGLMLLICGGILLLFAVRLGIKVFKAALDTIYHGFMSIFGFAAGGFVYGPTQTFLVRNVVDGFVAAARMTVYTIFLAVYVLFLGNLFEQAEEQTIAVIVVAGVVELVALSQLKQLSEGLSRGNNWIANRVASAIQGPPAKSGVGGGTALGMGTSRAGNSMKGLNGLSALNTINASPVAAWVLGGTVNPLNPLSRARKKLEKTNMKTAPMNLEAQVWAQLSRENFMKKAIGRAEAAGIHTPLGVANLIDGLGDNGVPPAMWTGIVVAAGGSHQHAIDGARALSVQKASMSQDLAGFAPLQKAVAASLAVRNHETDRARLGMAAQAVVAADNFKRHASKPIDASNVDLKFANYVLNNADSEEAMRAITPRQWSEAGRDTRWHIGSQLAENHQAAARKYYQISADPQRTHLLAAAKADLATSTQKLMNVHRMSPSYRPDPWSA